MVTVALGETDDDIERLCVLDAVTLPDSDNDAVTERLTADAMTLGVVVADTEPLAVTDAVSEVLFVTDTVKLGDGEIDLVPERLINDPAELEVVETVTVELSVTEGEFVFVDVKDSDIEVDGVVVVLKPVVGEPELLGDTDDVGVVIAV